MRECIDIPGGLYDHQLEAVKKMHNGCILDGDVGTGKSRTALAYYWIEGCRGPDSQERLMWQHKGGQTKPEPPRNEEYDDYYHRDLYIITTARKRNDEEWWGELRHFGIYDNENSDPYPHRVVIDSWNNIGKYGDVENAFFIFDEQRAIGHGTWAKSFMHLAKWNDWIMLSATPGDEWIEYMAVFIANGFYRNQTQFKNLHVAYSTYTQFPKIVGYMNTKVLEKHRDDILVFMKNPTTTEKIHETMTAEYPKEKVKALARTRLNPTTNEPIQNGSEYCACMRRIVNADPSRQTLVRELAEKHGKCIIFYMYNFELSCLIDTFKDWTWAQYNGFAHEPVPTEDRWVYFVQYGAGAEGWNCITCDTMIFYSQSYSYKQMTQAAGRIDRLNTPYSTLYYYHLTSKSSLDLAIEKALHNKKNFNQSAYYGRKGE